MRTTIRNGILVFSFLLISSVNFYAKDVDALSQSEIYPGLAGHYELTLNGRTLGFNVIFRADEKKLYFQALGGPPGSSPLGNEMLPVESRELTFITQDPAGQRVEIHFEVDRTGGVTRCEVSVVDRGWKGQAIQLSRTPKETSQETQPVDIPLTGSYPEQISQTVKDLVEKGLIVGGEILILKDHQIDLHEVYGWSDIERKIPLMKNSIYRIRSMSKPFIATAILILNEEGKLQLDDPVFQYISSFDNEKSRSITVRQLLIHKGGFRQEEMPEGYWEKSNLREAVDLLGKTGPPETPGERFIYSDMNSAVLGAIVHEITGEPVEGFIQKRILDPLDMENTYTDFKPDYPWSSRMNSTYRFSDGSLTKYWDNTQPQSAPFFRASGGLYTSVSDYARFLQVWMDGGVYRNTRLLKAETIQRAIKKYDGLGRDRGYGMHWEIFSESEKPNILPPFGHGGSDGTVAMAIPSKNMLILFFTQTRGTPALERDFLPLIKRLFF